MNKTTYLNQEDVKAFIDWLRDVARDEANCTFSHSYEIETNGKSSIKRPWQCKGLFDAKEKYNWPFSYYDLLKKEKVTGKSLSENQKVLSDFSSELKNAVNCDDNNKCYCICVMILDWGGVLGSDKKGNKKLLNELKNNLCEYLSKAKSLFESESIILDRRYNITVQYRSRPVIMNSGFTKIYSLLCNNFVIYDSRVGAALGLLVRNFLERNEAYEQVPEPLSFYYGNAKNPKVNRNPSTGKYQFKALSSSYPVHIRNNLKTNWLFDALLKGNCGSFSEEKGQMRALECALFMIGYRV